MLLLCFVLGGLLLLWGLGYVGLFGEICFLSYDTGGLGFYFMVDSVSCVCLFMLLCCGSIALFYCFHYFSGDDNGSLLFLLVVLFLTVMGVLVHSASLIFSLVFWEYLGLVSFFLILFYSNMSSLRASLITLFASRFGDAALFVLIMWLCNYFEYSGVLFFVSFLFVVMSKSACFPFVSWLLEAMRAPTPVSSLVHSSTLVAAGAWFLFRYECLGGSSIFWGLVYFCLVTVLLTAFSAVVYMDLKKIVALSTCNNISWCLLFYILGDLELALLQLFTHGVCKCYLFMSVGDLMSQSGSSQSGVGVFLSRYSGSYLSFLQGYLVLSLCGIPFLGVFFGKHGLMSIVLSNISLGLMFLVCVCLLLSYVYSVRFCLLLMSSLGGINYGYSSLFVLLSPLVFLGTLMNDIWFLSIGESVVMGSWDSFLVLFLQVLGCVLGYWLYYSFMGCGMWSSLLWGCEGFVSSVYYWFLDLSGLCLVSFYRWEVYLLNKWSVLNTSFYGSVKSIFSMNFLVLGVLFFLFLSLIVG